MFLLLTMFQGGFTLVLALNLVSDPPSGVEDVGRIILTSVFFLPITGFIVGLEALLPITLSYVVVAAACARYELTVLTRLLLAGVFSTIMTSYALWVLSAPERDGVLTEWSRAALLAAIQVAAVTVLFTIRKRWLYPGDKPSEAM